jgi:hypothetical protein
MLKIEDNLLSPILDVLHEAMEEFQLIKLGISNEWKLIGGIADCFVNKSGKVSNSNGKILKAMPIGRRGYLAVRICRDRKTKILYVHRLVAESFIPNPLNKPVVNHIDGDKKNNDVSNLEWSTYSENLQHAYDLGLRKPNTRRNSGMFIKGSNINPKKSIEKGG